MLKEPGREKGKGLKMDLICKHIVRGPFTAIEDASLVLRSNRCGDDETRREREREREKERTQQQCVRCVVNKQKL